MEDDLITTKEVGDYRIKVYYCRDPECPITNWGLFGSFFFEYSDTHRLHDECNWKTFFYDNKHDLRDVIDAIVMKHIEQKDIVKYLKKGEANGISFTYNRLNCQKILGLSLNKIQDMERLNFETLFRIVRWDYNRCFKDESLDKDLFVEKYGKVMGEHYYNKFVHEFDGNILKMIGYFRGSEKEGQVFCDMITERIEKYEKRMSYDKGKLNN